MKHPIRIAPTLFAVVALTLATPTDASAADCIGAIASVLTIVQAMTGHSQANKKRKQNALRLRLEIEMKL